MVKLTRLALAVLGFFAASAAGFAEEKPILRIYAYDGFTAEWGPGPGLKAGFEKDCGCTVQFIATDSSIGSLRRVQLEGAGSQADIVLGLDTAIAGEARNTGLFVEHGLDLAGLDLPVAWTDKTFAPFDWGYFAYVYNKTKLANPPHSFKELIAAPESFKIAIQDPRSATPGLGHLLWIEAAYGNEAPEIWKGLKPHILTMTREWSEAYALFLKGEVDMVLSYTTSPVYHAIAEDDPNYAFAEFTEGHLPQIEVSGILKSSKHQELASKFLAYLISHDAQKTIATTNWMYPVVDLGAELPAAFNEQAKPAKVLSLDEATITANRGKWIEEALDAIK
jgi:thiamine transport system substrate-binding protein